MTIIIIYASITSIMGKRISAHVVTTTRRYKGKVYHSHLLRRSYREGKTVRKETIANLSPLGDEIVELIRCALRGEKVAPVDRIFEVVNSHHHGHIQAVRMAMKRLGFYNLIASHTRKANPNETSNSRGKQFQRHLCARSWDDLAEIPGGSV